MFVQISRNTFPSDCLKKHLAVYVCVCAYITTRVRQRGTGMHRKGRDETGQKSWAPEKTAQDCTHVCVHVRTYARVRVTGDFRGPRLLRIESRYFFRARNYVAEIGQEKRSEGIERYKFSVESSEKHFAGRSEDANGVEESSWQPGAQELEAGICTDQLVCVAVQFRLPRLVDGTLRQQQTLRPHAGARSFSVGRRQYRRRLQCVPAALARFCGAD